MGVFSIPSLDEIAHTIGDKAAPIVKRMRCLFQARHYGGKRAVDALKNGLGDSSVLLVHEMAYLLGQVGDSSAIPCLVELLNDMSQHDMIRHEAAEAIAAIGSLDQIELIRQFCEDPSQAVRETCYLALQSLLEKKKEKEEEEKANLIITSSSPSADDLASQTPASTTPIKFSTVDPIAKTNQSINEMSEEELKNMLLNQKGDLYLRYEALFRLRDLGTETAHEAIILALKEDTSSALFRHEVAFVLGQIQTPASVSALVSCLQNQLEDPMARHESALALGSVVCSDFIEGPLTLGAKKKISDSQAISKGNEQSEKDEEKVEMRRLAVKNLIEYSKDIEPIVYESCLVALDNIAVEIGSFPV